jgi:hypothetical protein
MKENFHTRIEDMFTKHFPCTTPTGNALDGLEAFHRRNNWTEPIPREAAADGELSSRHVYITSADRNLEAHPDPFDFRTDIGSSFRNVVSVRVLQAVFPNTGDLQAQPHIFIDFPELQPLERPANGSSYTAMSTFAPHFGSRAFLSVDARTLSPPGCVFKPPRARLETLTFCIRRFDGTKFTGGNALLGSILPEHQVSMTLEIITRQRKNPLSAEI